MGIRLIRPIESPPTTSQYLSANYPNPLKLGITKLSLQTTGKRWQMEQQFEFIGIVKSRLVRTHCHVVDIVVANTPKYSEVCIMFGG